MTEVRPTQVLRAVRGAAEGFVHIIVGLLLMAIGGWILKYALAQKPVSNVVFGSGLGLIVFGALCMPTILPLFKQVIVFVFPNGIPLVGGKRAGDPPAQP